MSTLINYLLAVVLSILQPDALPQTAKAVQTCHKIEHSTIKQQLKPNHLISKEELLLHINEKNV